MMKATLAHVQRTDHRMEIAPRVARRSMIRKDHSPHVTIVCTRLHELDRWESKSFLIHVCRIRGKTSWCHSANLRDVTNVPGETDQFLIVEDGLHHHVFRQMTVSPIRIVVDDNVAWL